LRVQLIPTTSSLVENSKSNVKIFPNPTNGYFSIDLGESYTAITITITDLKGRVIQSNTYNESQLLSLKLEEPAGVYLLMIESENKETLIKLIKE